MATAKEMIKKGYKWFCMGCSTAYKEKPTTKMEGQGCDYDYEMCRCTCDLFMSFEEYIKMNKKKKKK